jgi:hypothetical protein
VRLLRWLRETAGRQVPEGWYYRGIGLALAVLFVFRYVLGFGWLQAIVLGSIVAAALASIAKLVWAAANPLSESDIGDSYDIGPFDDGLDSEALRPLSTQEELDWDPPPDSGGVGGAGSRVPRRPPGSPWEAGAEVEPPVQSDKAAG